MSTKIPSSSFRSNLAFLDFAKASSSQAMDYRKRVAAENLHLSASSLSSASYALKSGRTLLQQSEFFELQPMNLSQYSKDLIFEGFFLQILESLCRAYLSK